MGRECNKSINQPAPFINQKRNSNSTNKQYHQLFNTCNEFISTKNNKQPPQNNSFENYEKQRAKCQQFEASKRCVPEYTLANFSLPRRICIPTDPSAVPLNAERKHRSAQ
ncbi:hypothetical protein AVEN_4568-1 [Araneus ventricosus]|uniref:Uncharacterized protein n=1 Tax=Araneus ventricosus TaxID=182803 RepID=A0A4Y2W7P5_ARAVE|nr:hypothetical protein AVEN_4568-1 [Araneus ventricosus]